MRLDLLVEISQCPVGGSSVAENHKPVVEEEDSEEVEVEEEEEEEEASPHVSCP
ncbi:unnamed protein product [Pleuronectes platessa]|uniref:Uncharacterized protein n=1 Tax=Pleuronectes platessa TaxID=8262 RepID=A0A9N7VV60_PLEPL|nr:unnamed protein product [Pleuronectes platessa]